MSIFFGTAFLGKVKALNGQFIETKFFLFFVPLFPIKSTLVLRTESFNKKTGIDIPLNPTSVIAAYTRVFVFLLAALFLYIGLVEYSLPQILSGIILFVTWIYFCFFYGRTTSNEVNLRTRLGKSIGLYALPEWLYSNYVNDCYERLKKQYLDKYKTDWKEDLMCEHVDVEKGPILYGIALFNYMNFETPENEFFFQRAYHLLD